MSATSLRDRLNRLGGTTSRRPSLVRLLPRGFEEFPTRYGTAVLRQDVIPLPPLEPHPGNVAYVDTETTGLSGGSGTLAFAAAIARPIDCGLRVAQLLLPQPGLEAAFLAALSDELEPADEVATFNGGSFDLPVLRTRWVMARMPGELLAAPHIDLLTLVRALYRHRLESCTLRMVEERVLGYERDDPIPSALVPDAYFAYLREGSLEFLEAALEHNRLDVISLVHLHSRLLVRLQGDEAGMDAADWLALGRHRFRRGARADGWRALRNATSFAKGEAAADRLLDWLETTAAEDIRVSIARARLLEWRRRDPHQALNVVEAAQRRMPQAAPDLEHRRDRLRRKVESDRGRNKNRSHSRKRQVGEVQLEAPIADCPA